MRGTNRRRRSTAHGQPVVHASYGCRPARRSIDPLLLIAISLVIGSALITAFAQSSDPFAPPTRAQSRAGNATSPYTWEDGPPDDPTYFPLGVWLQDPRNAAAYREIGINLYVGLWKGPTEDQLAMLADVGMPVMATQNGVGLERMDASILVGWTHQDEPDNAQPDGMGGYGPCVDPDEIQERYGAMKARDPDRPVWLNLGQGVAWDPDRPYVGRGSACAGRREQYPEYVKGADIISFDIYPVTSRYDHIRGDLSRVALGVERLVEWSDGEKLVWNVVETAHIHSDVRPSPHQIRAEVWMSIIHGSMGIVYFAHEWQPRFREAALLHYQDTRQAVAMLNAEITSLAPVLNRPTRSAAVETTIIDGAEVATLVKQHDDQLYVFAVAMDDAPARAQFTLTDGGHAPRTDGGGPPTVEVVGEDRTVELEDDAFRDDFDAYGVHIYRIPIASSGEAGQRAYLPIASPVGSR